MNYSRSFNPLSDILISQGSASDPCMTSFFKFPLCEWLLNVQPADYFVKSEEYIGPRLHFTFQAYRNNSQQGVKIGELPCPEQCLPDQPFLEFKKFKPEHLFELAFQVVGANYIVLQKCKVNEGSGPVDSYAIYGHDGHRPMDNPQLHKIYVSIQ